MGDDRSGPAVIVLDIGKTHVKMLAVAPDGTRVLEARQTVNQSLPGPPYLHVDVEAIWAWLIEALADFAGRFRIEAIIPCAYGSTAALIDDHGLVLPMMDYEAEPPTDIADAYATVAPDFDEVCCPINPACLTLARQLFWQSRAFGDQFASTRWILPAAQYWAWRLNGNLATEVTSLGAQTQLWNPRRGTITDLARNESWSEKFPPLRSAFDRLGPVAPAIANQTGLAPRTPVLVGIHDSNANFARYLKAGYEKFTLVSSGTWLITFDTDLPLNRLDPTRDMVANTDLEGRPVACTRFMGGREFFQLAAHGGLAGGKTLDWTSTPGDVARLIGRGTMALPSFTDTGGPCPGTGNQGRIEGPPPETPAERVALACLYVALMTDIDLDLLASTNPIIIDGSFADNAIYTGLLAALRPDQTIMISRERDGTALGAALLWQWQQRPTPLELELEPVAAIHVGDLDGYAKAWLRRIELCDPGAAPDC